MKLFLLYVFFIFCGLNICTINFTQFWGTDRSKPTGIKKLGRLYWGLEFIMGIIGGTFSSIMQSGEFISIILLLVLVASMTVFFSIFGKVILFISIIIYFVLLFIYQHRILYNLIHYFSKTSNKPTENYQETLLPNPYFSKKMSSLVFGTIITIIIFIPVIFIALRWL
jgi:hypothetical protein